MIDDHLAPGGGIAADLVIVDLITPRRRSGFAAAGTALAALGRTVSEICQRFLGAAVTHVSSGDLVILIDPDPDTDRSADLDQALATRPGRTPAPGRTGRSGESQRQEGLVGAGFVHHPDTAHCGSPVGTAASDPGTFFNSPPTNG